MSVLSAIHNLAAIIWVGGMFFALVVLRPGAGHLDPAVRLGLWERVLQGFFVWSWLSVLALLVSGFAMLFAGFGGFIMPARYISLMAMMGILMAAIFTNVYFSHWPQFRHSVAASDWTEAERVIRRMRRLAWGNLLLGLTTVFVADGGRHFG